MTGNTIEMRNKREQSKGKKLFDSFMLREFWNIFKEKWQSTKFIFRRAIRRKSLDVKTANLCS